MQPTTADPLPTRRQAIVFACLQLPTLLYAVVYAYTTLFSSLARHDDEGTLMMMVKSTLDHQRIYEDVLTPYGPIYNLYQTFIHRTLNLPLTDDFVRYKSLAMWVFSGSAAGLFGLLISRNVVIAIVAQLAVFMSVCRLVNEPGHPQELIFALLMLLLLASVWHRKHPLPASALMGAIVGMVFFMKVNNGAFATTALGVALVACVPPGKIRGVGLASAILLLCAVPTVITFKFWSTAAEPANYNAMITLAFLPIAIELWRRRPDTSMFKAWRDVAASALGFIAVALLGAWYVISEGSSIASAYFSTVVLPGRLLQYFYLPVHIEKSSVALTVLSAAIGVWAVLTKNPNARFCVLLAGKIAFAAFMLSAFLLFWETNYGSIRLAYGVAWAWLAFVPLRAPDEGRIDLTRTLACGTAIFSALWAFPVAGTQWSLSTFMMTIPAIYCLSDVVDEARHAGWTQRIPVRFAPLAAAIAIAVIGGTVYRLADLAKESVDRFRSSAPLNFVGASVRVRAESKQQLTELINVLHHSPGTFFVFGGRYILYFWADKPMPTSVIVGHRLSITPKDLRDRLFADILAKPDMIVVVPDRSFDISSPEGLSLLSHFEPWQRIGDFLLYRRLPEAQAAATQNAP